MYFLQVTSILVFSVDFLCFTCNLLFYKLKTQTKLKFCSCTKVVNQIFDKILYKSRDKLVMYQGLKIQKNNFDGE